VSGVRSVITYIVVSLYLLIVGPIGIALVLIFRAKGLLYELGHAGVGLALASAGIRYRVIDRDRIPRDRAVVFCSNHQSNVDPPVLFQSLHRRLHILYKAELSRLPILGRVLRLGDFVPVERENREEAFRAIEQAAQSIRAGNSFLIFPEGTRSRTDQLLPFKKGGFIMALHAQAPIVPVAVKGGRDSMRKGSWVIRPVNVTVRIGEPIQTTGMSDADRDRLIALVRERIDAMLRA
jgi:1-acyl-sn-glycerol-3-phosphate acyltransferase